MAVKLSKPGKMPCKSWSLQAIDTCPGSINPTTGGLVPACEGCYATDGNYRFKNVRSVREHNKADWKRSDWVADMVTAIGKDSHFRWFDSGDVYSVSLLKKIQQVIKATPNTAHWLPTRMYKFPKFAAILSEIAALPNAVVRFSSDGINGETIHGRHTSTIVQPNSVLPSKATLCQAYDNNGKCGDCRACWNKAVPVIAYPAHGRKMKSLAMKLL